MMDKLIDVYKSFIVLLINKVMDISTGMTKCPLCDEPLPRMENENQEEPLSKLAAEI